MVIKWADVRILLTRTRSDGIGKPLNSQYVCSDVIPRIGLSLRSVGHNVESVEDYGVVITVLVLQWYVCLVHVRAGGGAVDSRPAS